MVALSISLMAGNAKALAKSHKHSHAAQDKELIAGFPFSKSKSDAKAQTDISADSKESDTSSDKETKKAEKKKSKELKKGKADGQDQETAKAKATPAQAPQAKAAAPAKTQTPAAKATANPKAAPAKASTADSATKPPAKHAAAQDAEAATATPAAAPAGSEEVAEQVEEKPVFVPDSALISLLKDLSRSLADQEQLDKIEDANEKSVLELAKRVLSKALENPELKSNRIVDTKSGAQMTTEAWSSGDVKLSDDCHGSLAVVWGKRENGLMNVTIAGNCPDKAADGKKIGEFIVVLGGRSSVEKGFDIQSQSDVNFWLAKLGNMTVDADCCNVVETAKNGDSKDDKGKDEKVSKTADSETKEVKKNSTIVLQAILTERGREYLAQMQVFDGKRKLIAQKQEAQAKEKADAQEQERLKSEEKEKAEAESRLAQAEAEVAVAKAKAEIAAKAVKQVAGAKADKDAEGSDAKDGIAGDDSRIAKKPDDADETDKGNKEKVAGNQKDTQKESDKKESDKKETDRKETDKKVGKETGSESTTKVEAAKEPNRSRTATDEQASVKGPPIDRDDWSGHSTAKPPETTANSQPGATTIATASFTRPNQSASMGWEAPAVPVGPKQPSMSATVVMPERALAGQYLTAAVIDGTHNPEVGVELSFNGVSLTTDAKGQATFMVPEDATPGRSLNVSLSSRSDLNPGLIEIFQPLTVSANQDVPRIDKVSQLVSNTGTLTIDGHNFDGQAEHNRVIIDGISEGKVTASSPVQLRVGLPPNLTAGSHTVSVSTSGLRGNPGLFSLIAAEVQTDPKDNRIVVRVRGTTDKMQVHVTNQNPDVIKISRGNDIHVTTTGGDLNQTTLGVQRLRKGSYRVTADIERL